MPHQLKLIFALVLLFGRPVFCSAAPAEPSCPSISMSTESAEPGSTLAAKPAIRWLDDPDKAIQRAREANRPVMAYFHSSANPKCRAFEKNILADAEVIKFSADFVCFKVDGDKNKPAIGRFKVGGYPVIIFMNSKGEEVNRISGVPRIAKALSLRMKEIAAAQSGGVKKVIVETNLIIEQTAPGAQYDYELDNGSLSLENKESIALTVNLRVAPARITVTVVNEDQKVIRRLLDAEQKPGSVNLDWDGAGDDGKKVPPGKYQIVLRVGEMTDKADVQVDP
jgi:thiol-disulfide isomerase/thioredoxin